MNDLSTHLNLPYLMPSQAQKHVTVNEAFRALDLIVQLAVLDRDLTNPPTAPADGDRYIVASTATGAWAGEEGKIAAWVDGAWQFLAAKAGWTAWIADEVTYFVYDGTTWSTISGASGIGAFNEIGIGGAVSDAANKLAVQSPAVLFNHDGNDIQAKLNKAAAADTASVLFQTGFSGRAEFGLTGDDDWHVKVSPDGSTWFEALIVDNATGYLGLGSEFTPIERLHLHEPVLNGGAAIQCTNLTSGATSTDGLWFGYSNQVWFWNYENTDMSFATNNSTRLTIAANGDVGIGVTNPAAKLDVDGVVKVKSYTVATLPAAVAGGMIFVSDETGGAVLAFGDGTNWRRVTDRAVVA